jgi:Holliday junction DNA helicase RuvA
MIVTLQGTLAAATPLHAVVELNGLGYEVNIPVTTAEKLPPPGAQVKLHTHVIYREDAQTLYGFATAAERDFFRLMIEHVTGIGPKSALTIMSKLSLPLLESAIRAGDIATLAKCPGIGKKTAERLVVELKTKVGGTGLAGAMSSADGGETSSATADRRQPDAVAALVALGYKAADADQSVRRAALALGAGATTEKLIKKALGST